MPVPVPTTHLRRQAPWLITAVLLLTAACGGAPAASGADAGPPRPGGTLRFAVSSDQGCVDPQQVSSNDTIYSLRQIVDSLTDQDPESGELRPWLATAWESNADATAYTFTLREGVTFSDGTPLDAAAVAANFDAVARLGPRASLPKGYLAGYRGTAVESPTRFTVAFDEPNVQFLQGTSTHSLGILAQATVARSDDDRCASVIGSGPFVLDSYTRDESIVLAKRPGYAWGSSLWAHQGEAYLDRLEFRIVPESGVRVGSLASGEVDGIGNIAQQDEALLVSGGVQLLARSNPGIPFGISFNHSTPLGADPAVREAVSLGIDRAEVVATVYTSQTRPATSPLASNTPAYADQSAQLAFDPARAGAVLDAAGWLPGPDGVRVKGGTPLSVELTWFANAAANRPTVELLQQQLRRIGIDLQVREVPIAENTPTMQEGRFTAAWGNLTRADPDILRSQYGTAGNNYYRLPAGPLDALLTRQAAQPDTAARAETVAQAQQLLVGEHHVVPVVELTTVLGVAANVHGVAFDASSRLQLHDAWKAE
ncbi:ABC transporter substrate-binding protein [Pseudonocardia sp. MH-G8]|uniref:ABC transporter substrate-binding protein n=1 Tax=Pseudonocardia sp. MH-G8 TaxID=1854588 RepID=UPI000BA04D07|nr:ABC transporter substrate-binding protein [Pseudonocardia sp. MH-G8]OZM78752.1 ABC transporter substrate-binding protein [Pseudonocardia sp. MH-G8]